MKLMVVKVIFEVLLVPNKRVNYVSAFHRTYSVLVR